MEEEVGKKIDREGSTDHQPSAPHEGVSIDHQPSVQLVQPATVTKVAEAYRKFAVSVFSGRAPMIREANLRRSAPMKNALLLGQMFSQACDDAMEDDGSATDSLVLEKLGTASKILAESVLNSDTAIIAREGKRSEMPETDF